jgi:beta-ketoacyl-acyl-carrier-protein synthase II
MSIRVVVTGIGMITPIGLDAQSTWTNLLDGISGVRHLEDIKTEGLRTTIGAQIIDFQPDAILGRKEARRMDRFAQFAVVAANEAVTNAALKIDETNSDEVAVVVGSGIGGITTLVEQYDIMREKGPTRVSPFLMPMMLGNLAAGQVSIHLGARGPITCPVTACSTGADAIGEAYGMIRNGIVTTAITGGTEASITPIVVAGFNSCNALSERNDEPSKASRPFDAHRDGFVLGEGAGILVLESLDSALARGAKPIAEMISYAATGDAFHVTLPPPDGNGTVRAMHLALKRAGIEAREVDYLNAHGTSTPINDASETNAIKNVFGEYAYRLPISSTKSMVGHLLGAAGSVEAAVTILAIRNSVIPPTINLENLDPECDLDYTPIHKRLGHVRIGMSNSMGFGGHNSSLLFKQYESE